MIERSREGPSVSLKKHYLLVNEINVDKDDPLLNPPNLMEESLAPLVTSHFKSCSAENSGVGVRVATL